MWVWHSFPCPPLPLTCPLSLRAQSCKHIALALGVANGCHKPPGEEGALLPSRHHRGASRGKKHCCSAVQLFRVGEAGGCSTGVGAWKRVGSAAASDAISSSLPNQAARNRAPQLLRILNCGRKAKESCSQLLPCLLPLPKETSSSFPAPIGSRVSYFCAIGAVGSLGLDCTFPSTAPSGNEGKATKYNRIYFPLSYFFCCFCLNGKWIAEPTLPFCLFMHCIQGPWPCKST